MVKSVQRGVASKSSTTHLVYYYTSFVVVLYPEIYSNTGNMLATMPMCNTEINKGWRSSIDHLAVKTEAPSIIGRKRSR